MVHDKKVSSPKIDLEAEALIALEQARNMKPGVERTEASHGDGFYEAVVRSLAEARTG